MAAAADKKIERTQDIHQLYSASKTFQIFGPLNIDILLKIERIQDIHQLYSASQTFQIFEPLNIDILQKAYS